MGLRAGFRSAQSSGWHGTAWRMGRATMRVLLVEDHPALREMMTDHLAQRGFAVDPVACAGDARAALATVSYDGLILDLGLPDGDGMAILRETRARATSGLPTLLVTARDALEDRVRGLNAGADDYIVKPFDLPELEARLRAVLRRSGPRAELTLCHGGLAFDPASRQASLDGVVLDLTRRETDLLEQLLRAAGQVVKKGTLEGRLYSSGEPVTANALEAAVSRLRKRLASTGAGVRVEAKRGIGYRLVAGDDAGGGPAASAGA
jgi:two-component system, OmpR family, response regulator QseB